METTEDQRRNLESTQSTALNQCSSMQADVTWSDHRRLKIDLAAALMTDFRRRNCISYKQLIQIEYCSTVLLKNE